MSLCNFIGVLSVTTNYSTIIGIHYLIVSCNKSMNDCSNLKQFSLLSNRLLSIMRHDFTSLQQVNEPQEKD